jgi:hypothetical protein
VDPGQQRKAEKGARSGTFDGLADAWLDRQRSKTRADGTIEKLEWLISLVRPKLGKLSAGKMTRRAGSRRAGAHRRRRSQGNGAPLPLGAWSFSGTTGFLRQHDHRATVAAINKTIAGAKAAGTAVCLGVNSRPAEQRNLIVRGVLLLATLNCWRVAHCARSRPIARRSATEAAGVETSTRATAIVDVRSHISYTMRQRPRGKKATALAR